MIKLAYRFFRLVGLTIMPRLRLPLARLPRPMRRWPLAARFVHVVTLLTFVASLLPIRVARAADDGPPPDPLPAGGSPALGAMETDGAGWSGALASVAPSTGAATFTYPIAVPPARGHAANTLVLSYNSSRGESAFGVGWSLGLPSIERRSPGDLVAPTFKDPKITEAYDSDQHDRFVIDGEPLVMVCNSHRAAGTEGGFCDEGYPSFIDISWRYFRRQYDRGGAHRFFMSPDGATWVVQTKSETMVFGRPLFRDYTEPYFTASYVKQAMPDGEHIYRWNLVQRFDNQRTANGYPANQIAYVWTDDGLLLASVYDTPKPGVDMPDISQFAHRVTFEANAKQVLWGHATAAPAWRRVSPNTISRIIVSSAFFDASSPGREVVRQYHLTYLPNSRELQHAYLESIQLEGKCGEAGATRAATSVMEDSDFLFPADGSTNCPRLPPTTFGYTLPVPSFPKPVTLADLRPVGPDGALRTPDPVRDPSLFDFDSDGVPDLLEFYPAAGSVPAALLARLSTKGGPSLDTPVTLAGDSIPNTAIEDGAPVPTFETPREATRDLRPYDVPNFRPEFLIPGNWEGEGTNTLLVDPGISTGTGNNPATVRIGYSSLLIRPGDMGIQLFGLRGAKDWTVAAAATPNLFSLSGAAADWNGDGLTDIPYVWHDCRDNPINGCVIDTHNYSTMGFSTRDSRGYVHPGGRVGILDPATLPRVTTAYPHKPTTTPGYVESPTRQFADMDGDGLLDLLIIEGYASIEGPVSSAPVKWYRNHGNGVFGEPVSCASDAPQGSDCALGPAPMFGPKWVRTYSSFGSQGYDEKGYRHYVPFVHVVDVTGDGFADVVLCFDHRLEIWPNKDAGTLTQFDKPIVLEGDDLPDDYDREHVGFADVNGSGVSDIVFFSPKKVSYIDPLNGMRPGLMYAVFNGLGGTTTFKYESTYDLAQVANPPWSTRMPSVTHVVTAITTTNNLTAPGRRVERTTKYDYRDPQWDKGPGGFKGFANVRATAANGVTTDSSFLAINLPGRPDGGMIDGDFRYGLRGALVAQTVHTNGEIFSATHSRWHATSLGLGADGRPLSSLYVDRTDRMLYPRGTSLAPGGLALPDWTGLPPATNTLVQTAPGAAHIVQERTVDSNGNETALVQYGNRADDGTPIDDVLRTESDWSLVGDPGAWQWRPQATRAGSVVGDTFTPARQVHFVDYDAAGNATRVTGDLTGTVDLLRHHENAKADIAPLPFGRSADGTIEVTSVTIDTLGNVTHVLKGGRLGSTITYDPAWGEMATGVTQENPQGTNLTSMTGYDRGLGVALFSSDPSLVMTSARYDGFGRIISSAAFELLPNGATRSTDLAHVDYDIRSDAQIVHTTTFPGSALTPAPNGESYTYLDGLGNVLATLTKGDPDTDGATWSVGSRTDWDAQLGWANETHRPEPLPEGANPRAFAYDTPSTTPSLTLSRDPLGRLEVVGGYDHGAGMPGTVLRAVGFSPLGTFVQDAEQFAKGGALAQNHLGSLGTRVDVDGHGRLVRTVQNFESPGAGALQSITTTAHYDAVGNLRSIERTDGHQTRVRTLEYDSLGRLVRNVEPNAGEWRYAYDDAGELVGTSDARGCGENLAYDALGRLVSEDYSPCTYVQPEYTRPGLSTNAPDVGTEAYYRYDTPEPDQAVPADSVDQRWLGRLTAIEDRGAHTRFAYDVRGRANVVSRQVAKPYVPEADPRVRYAPHWYERKTTFDNADRVYSQTTGADADLHLREPGTLDSSVTLTYSTAGALASATSTYGLLVASTKSDVEGNLRTRIWGDVARTTESFDYAMKPFGRVLSHVQVSRGEPALWSGAPTSTYVPPLASAEEPTSQKVLEDTLFEYDGVGHPTAIRDNRSADGWPSGAQPTTRTVSYDDLYRVTQVDFSGPTGALQTDASKSTPPGFPATVRGQRVGRQTFVHDAFGNITSSDDDTHTFFDRSLGTSKFENDRLTHAESSSGSLDATYDAAGNVVQLEVKRSGPCTGPMNDCWQYYFYFWDEVGRLMYAERADAYHPASSPAGTEVDGVVGINYEYDSGGNRVLRAYQDGNTIVEIFPSLRLEHASCDGNEYERTDSTEVVYLEAGGTVFGRLAYAPNAPSPTGDPRHVFLEIGDHLGSTSIVIDNQTSELVERSTYTATGAQDSDYAPGRWGSFREVYRFTGKENDEDVGLTYFGARYYSPYLARWMSPDPLTIHGLGADPNPYAYVGGQFLSAVDPFGFDGDGELPPQDVMTTTALQTDGRGMLTETWVPTSTGYEAVPMDAPASQPPIAVLAVDTSVPSIGPLDEEAMANQIEYEKDQAYRADTLGKNIASPFSAAISSVFMLEGKSSKDVNDGATVGLGLSEAFNVIALIPVRVGAPPEPSQTWSPAPAKGGTLGLKTGICAGSSCGGGGVRGTAAEGSWAAKAVEAGGTRRLATAGDTQFRTAADALAEALERHGIDPSTVETTTMFGKNPNLVGPKGQPWQLVEGLNGEGDIVGFQHHPNGHFFEDGTFELSHYHGPNGEHLTYGQ